MIYREIGEDEFAMNVIIKDRNTVLIYEKYNGIIGSVNSVIYMMNVRMIICRYK